MTFRGDDSYEQMNNLSRYNIELFKELIVGTTGPGLLSNIAKSCAEQFRLCKGPAYAVCANSWVPENAKGSFVRGYIKQAWSGRGITAVENFLAQTQQ